MLIDYKLNDKSLSQLCKYIALSSQQPFQYIDDLHLSTETSFSSVAVNEKLINQNNELKKYTDNVASGLSKLKFVLTTEQPTLTNTALNTIYLYSTTGSPYKQYLRINETQLLFLGDTEVSMDGYLKLTEADAKFATITNVNLISDAVVNKVSINQGVAKAGQMLIVSDSGTVTTTPFESADIDWTN